MKTEIDVDGKPLTVANKTDVKELRSTLGMLKHCQANCDELKDAVAKPALEGLPVIIAHFEKQLAEADKKKKTPGDNGNGAAGANGAAGLATATAPKTASAAAAR